MSGADGPAYVSAVTSLAATLRAQHAVALDCVARVLWASSSPASELLRRPAVRTPSVTHGTAEVWLRASWEPAGDTDVGEMTGAAVAVSTSVSAVVPGTCVPPRVNPIEIDAWAAALYPQWWAPAQLRLPARIFDCSREYVTFVTVLGDPVSLPEHVVRRLHTWPN